MIEREFGLDPVFAAVLAVRGFETTEAVDRYLYPSYDHLPSPELLPDYRAAVDEILGARERKELIFIHGDYDVDGITSSALFGRFLPKIGCQVHTHVPHRFKEGYGIHSSAVEAAQEMGAKLFLTCDCGSGALEQIERAKELGMRVVVTDHHLIGDVWPRADAFVNPHRPDSQYPYPSLSGVGVVFRLCEGITRELGMPVDKYWANFVEFATLGTIADVMPLTGDNRVIAKMGLPQLSQTKKASIQALKSVCRSAARSEIDNWTVDSRHVGYVLAPRLNAAGRIDDAAISLKLLLSNDPGECRTLAEELERINAARKQEQDRILREAYEMVEAENLHEKRLILVAKEGWHLGVVGIVAGKIREKYNRPAFVVGVDEAGQMWKGSGRSIDAFHLAEAIKAHPEIMGGGGHAKAAGCHFPTDNLALVRQALEDYAEQRLTEEDLLPVCHADVAVSAQEVSPSLFRDIQAMEPCGTGNYEARFFTTGTILETVPTRTEEHWQISLQTENGRSPRFVSFGLRAQHPDLKPGAKANLAFSIKTEEFKGKMYNKWVCQAIEIEPTA